MNRRRLRITGALLLSTLLLSFAETAGAATCAPAVAATIPSVTADADAMSQSAMPGMPGMPEVPSGHDCAPAHGNAPADENDAECPFAPPGSVGCLATISLPADVTRVNDAPHVRTFLPRSSEVAAHDLTIHSIFHPPKA